MHYWWNRTIVRRLALQQSILAGAGVAFACHRVIAAGTLALQDQP